MKSVGHPIFPALRLLSRRLLLLTGIIPLCYLFSAGLRAQALDVEQPKPDPYAASYFAAWGAARCLLYSEMVVTGTMLVNADSTASDVKGTIVVKDLLYGKAGDVPKAVPFEREVSAFIESQANTAFFGWNAQPMDKVDVIVFLRHNDGNQQVVKAVPVSGHAKLIDELRLLQTDGIRIDNPDALAKPLDSKLTPFAEDVRKRLFERVRSVPSRTTFGGETLRGWFMRDVNPPFDAVHPYPEMRYLLYLGDNEMSAYEKHQIDQIKPGMSCQDLRGFMCENGGLTASGEYYVRNNMRAVAVRIAFRPAAMPEAVIHDPAQRVLWLKEHPDISPSDAVVEAHSKPFLTSVCID